MCSDLNQCKLILVKQNLDLSYIQTKVYSILLATCMVVREKKEMGLQCTCHSQSRLSMCSGKCLSKIYDTSSVSVLCFQRFEAQQAFSDEVNLSG